jgi:hypothetical protein
MSAFTLLFSEAILVRKPFSSKSSGRGSGAGGAGRATRRSGCIAFFDRRFTCAVVEPLIASSIRQALP